MKRGAVEQIAASVAHAGQSRRHCEERAAEENTTGRAGHTARPACFLFLPAPSTAPRPRCAHLHGAGSSRRPADRLALGRPRRRPDEDDANQMTGKASPSPSLISYLPPCTAASSRPPPCLPRPVRPARRAPRRRERYWEREKNSMRVQQRKSLLVFESKNPLPAAGRKKGGWGSKNGQNQKMILHDTDFVV